MLHVTLSTYLAHATEGGVNVSVDLTLAGCLTNIRSFAWLGATDGTPAALLWTFKRRGGVVLTHK